MKYITALLALYLIISAVACKEFQVKEDTHGREYLHHEDSFTSTIHHIIDSQRKKVQITPEKYLNLMTTVASLSKGHSALRETQVLECRPDHPDFFKGFGNSAGRVKGEFVKVNTSSYCFKNIRFYWISDSDTQITFYIASYDKQHAQCSDGYVITTGHTYHFAEVLMTGVHKVTFKNLSSFELDFIKNNGVQPFRFCDSIINIIPDLIMTAELFIGGLGLNPNIPFFGSHVPMHQQELNVEFVKRATGFQWKKRKQALYFKDYPAEYFRSGDYFAITRFDGLDNIIHYGTGSHSGHSTMAIWERATEAGKEDELYVVESQDAWYWPTQGLQRTKWEDWKKQAHNADFNVVHMRLKDEFANKFDEKKAWDWFDKTKGMPYGYKNFVFVFMDTINQNLPPILDVEFIFMLSKIMENIVPELQTDIIMKEALNARLGITEVDKMLSLEEIQMQIMSGKTRFQNLAQAFAEPEVDKHMYSDGYSLVCSAYVASFYQMSGMLGDIEIVPAEFSPKDIYELDVFDLKSPRPAECVAADPDLPYCQIMGVWSMEMPEASTIAPYSHMNERCSSLSPDYIRLPLDC